YEAGGWRVEKHPRFLADLTGDGRADIVGFADAGVYVSLNNGDGTFQAPKPVICSFGYEAGGWRVEKHPRFLADLTGDGRPDIVGFADAGVYVSFNNGDGTFKPAKLVLDKFGYEAGGWRVEKHPRFLADLTGDGRAEIVGFADAGVYVSDLSDSSDPKPSVLIITSQEKLKNKYGGESFAQIEAKISSYIQALKNTEVGAVLAYVDSAASLEKYGLSPVNPENAPEIKKLIDKLYEKLSPHDILIIGGHSIIPFHILPNPCEGDGDTEVPSDSPYASDDDDFLIPEKVVARLPDDSSGNPSFLLSLIENITVRVKSASKKSFGFSAKVWKGASEAVYDTIEKGQDLKLSPPVKSDNLKKEWIDKKGYFYFNLHGSEDTANWYGQDDYTYPVAFAPDNLKDVNIENAVICTEACYGANIIEKEVEDALSLKFLAKKAACFVGSTKIAYGPAEPPNTDADLMVLKFFVRIKEGLSFGEAFLKAKQDFAQESIKNKGYLDKTEQKTLLEYVIFADPSAHMEEIE
ncbi:MAG: FG-GAP repeat domain-containing protein, partial [Methanosarcina sp.]